MCIIVAFLVLLWTNRSNNKYINLYVPFLFLLFYKILYIDKGMFTVSMCAIDWYMYIQITNGFGIFC